MMISKNFYLQRLDVVVNVYMLCVIRSVIVNVWQWWLCTFNFCKIRTSVYYLHTPLVA